MTADLRVLFDGYWWTDGPPSNRMVQRQLLLTWRALFPQDSLSVALRRSTNSETPELDGIRVHRTRLWPHGLSNVVELPIIARRERAQAVVAHNFTPPVVPGVTFVHDLMFVDHPEWFSRSERAYFSPMTPLLRRGGVVTSSAAEAQRIERVRPNIGPVRHIGLAVSPSLEGSTPEPVPGVDEHLGFAVTVGRLNVRKNLGDLLDGVAKSTRITTRTPLLVVGSGAHSGMPPELTEGQRRLVDSGRVRLLGFLSDGQLVWLYRNASLFATLSRDEGFGLTPLEAAHFGSPVLASDIPAHRETMGDRAHLVPLGVGPQALGGFIDSAWRDRSASPERPTAPPVPAYSWECTTRNLREAVLERVRQGRTKHD